MRRLISRSGDELSTGQGPYAVDSRIVGKQETMFWLQNHFMLIPRSLESMTAGQPTQRE